MTYTPMLGRLQLYQSSSAKADQSYFWDGWNCGCFRAFCVCRQHPKRADFYHHNSKWSRARNTTSLSCRFVLIPTIYIIMEASLKPGRNQRPFVGLAGKSATIQGERKTWLGSRPVPIDAVGR